MKKFNTLKNYDSEVIAPEADTPSTLDTESVGVHCFDCRKSLDHYKVYSFGDHRFCRECRMKIEDQKKTDEV